MPSILGRLIRLPLRFVPRGAVMRVLSGRLRGWRWIAGAATHGCWLGTYERLTQDAFAQHVRAGGVVYDVGANAGYFTLLASKLAGPRGAVYAFEPLPRNLEILRAHVRLNRATNVQVLPVAVSDRAGKARFATGNNPAMGGLAAAGDFEVPTVTLDEVRATTPAPQFIKMDIEGAELAALSAASSILHNDGPVILLSAHGHEQFRRCSDLLRGFGYALTVLVDGTSDGNYVVLARK
ncbi:MAG TPA: FkbM family methyltransferase [Thermoanaerobaculia bacterium]|nr:FkbM family methyltransferase [Thermoanaerobaculia bacterium]